MKALLGFRSLLVVVLIPGTVAGFVPLEILHTTGGVSWPGLTTGSVLGGCLMVFGISILLFCVWDFFAKGKGTLAPFDPPRRLVVVGLYRFTRNPMYNGVLASLLGEAWLFRSTALLKYAALVAALFHVFVLVYEEPALESQFGDCYRAYRRAVPRWGFRLRPFAVADAVGERSKEGA